MPKRQHGKVNKQSHTINLQYSHKGKAKIGSERHEKEKLDYLKLKKILLVKQFSNVECCVDV